MVADLLPADRADLVFGALADATRRDIVATTLRGELSVSALSRRYPVSLTAVQKHVAVLERAGLVRKRRHGREQLVGADAGAVHRAGILLEQLEAIWLERLERFSDILSEPDTGVDE